MTHIDPDDPKWTAYVLGELDETERAAVELELSSSEDARTMVEELRFAAHTLKGELRNEINVVPLTRQQRQAILSTARRPARWFNVRPTVWATGFAAATLALFLVTFNVRPVLERSETAYSTPTVPQTGAPAQANKAETQALHDSVQSPSGEKSKEKLARDEARPTQEEARVRATTNAAKKFDADALSETAAKDAVQPNTPVNSNAAVAGVSGRSVLPEAEMARGQGDQKKQESQSLQSPFVQNEQLARQNSAQGIPQVYAGAPATASIPPAAAPSPPPSELDRGASSLLKSAETRELKDKRLLTPVRRGLLSVSTDAAASSYLEVQKFLNQGQPPPVNTVRTGELINHFTYAYPQPTGDRLVGASIDAAPAPWNPQHLLVRVGIHTRTAALPGGSSEVRDVRAEVTFNHTTVNAYRRVGDESGLSSPAKFNELAFEAGSIAAGRNITILYEVVPTTSKLPREILTLTVRYKDPLDNKNNSFRIPLVDRGQTFSTSSVDFRFAAAVASFGMILQNSPLKGSATIDSVLAILTSSLGTDSDDARREFQQLVLRARQVLR